jgi:quinol monooxygenase YgiN
VRITRYPSLTEPQFFGCVAAFVDSLSGELNSASAALRRLESKRKGAAFAFEMALDRHRYGAAIVLERWSTLIGAFGAHLPFPRAQAIVEAAPERLRAAENILERLNRLLDVTDAYSPAVVESCLLALQSIGDIFVGERHAAEQDAKLGPMLSEDYTGARRIFLEDLAQR